MRLGLPHLMPQAGVVIVDFDADLIQRYDCSGPRYTSYPTARQFESHFDPERYKQEVAKSNDDPVPSGLSVYVHLPYCSSPCFYCGCTRLITRDIQKVARYLDRLLQEAALQGRLFDGDREVQQLHLGGGTPTMLTDDQLSLLWEGLRNSFHFSAKGPEASIEVDPRTVTPARIEAFRELGFNRASFGIQDFDPDVQEAVNRKQDATHCLKVIEAAKSAGFDSVSVDLIYGLPKQTLAGFRATLDTIIDARPGRVAVYAYAHLPQHFKAQHHILEKNLPSPGTRLQLLVLTVELLARAGYEYIGMDHFALPEDALALAHGEGSLQRNFQGYSTRAGLDLVGLGLSAIGHVGRVYAQNAKGMQEYGSAIDAGRLPITHGLSLSDDDLIRADVINRLMCYHEVRYQDIEHAHHIRFFDYFALELRHFQPLVDDGLLQLEPDRMCVLPRGRFLLRNLAMRFDAYLPGHLSGPVYSRVI